MSAFWDVRLGFRAGVADNYCEAGAHISVEYAKTAEEAVRLCREWRSIGPETQLRVVRVSFVEDGEWPRPCQ